MADYVDYSSDLKTAMETLRAQLQADDWVLPAIQGDVFDPAAYTKALNTSNLNVATAKAVSDPSAPGTSGDMTAGPLQVDLLDSLRRAFLHRHCYPWNRCVALARGRDIAQADPQGPLQSQLDYLQQVLKQGRGENQQ